MMLSRIFNVFFSWGIVLGLLSGPTHAADQCNQIFSYPVQSHLSPGKLTMSDYTKISGAESSHYLFLKKNITGQANCHNGCSWGSTGNWVLSCSVTGNEASAMSGVSFPSLLDELTS